MPNIGGTMKSVVLLLALTGACSAARIELWGVVDAIAGENAAGIQAGDEWAVAFELPYFWNDPSIEYDLYQPLGRRLTDEDGNTQVVCVYCGMGFTQALTPAAMDYWPDGWDVTITPDFQVVRAYIGSGVMSAGFGYEGEDWFIQDFNGRSVSGTLLSARLLLESGDEVLTPEPSSFLLAAPGLIAFLTKKRRSKGSTATGI
jgi:hypothetical protein